MSDFEKNWKRTAKAERARNMAEIARQWDEGARADRCRDDGCLTPDDCILNGCKVIARSKP